METGYLVRSAPNLTSMPSESDGLSVLMSGLGVVRITSNMDKTKCVSSLPVATSLDDEKHTSNDHWMNSSYQECSRG